MAAIYPIAQMADGGVKYSDGSIKYSSNTNAVGTSTGGYPVYNPQTLGATTAAQTPTTNSSSINTALSNYGTDAGPAYQNVRNAEEEARQAELASLNTEFDRLNANAQNQLGYLATQREQGLSSLQSQLGNVEADITKQKTNTEQNQQQQIKEAGSVARNTQSANRRTLRALGILDSSAAGELLSKPLNEFASQRAQIVQAGTQRLAELDDLLVRKTDEHANLVAQLENEYANLVGSIQTDLRFSDRERADAIRAVNASLSQRLSQIGMAQQEYQNQVNAQKMQWQMQLAELGGYQMPTADLNAITSSTPQLNPASIQNVGIYGTDEKKKSLYEA